MKQNIVLTGMSGCGKTTVGEQLARELGMPFMDTDAMIEEMYGPIPELFEKGEEFFRNAESRIVSRVSSLEGVIIATGGGVVLREKNIRLLKKNGIIIFIDRPAAYIAESIDFSKRPLLKGGPEALYELSEKRHPLYMACCDYRVVSDNDLSHTVNAILEILRDCGFITPRKTYK